MTKEISWLLNEKYGGVENDDFRKDVKRLQAGEPVDFVIGFKDFLGVKIDLSKKPLIPRVETEFWVEKAIQDILTNSSLSVCLVLDIFAGSGCIGLAIMRHIKNAKVTFADKKNYLPIRANWSVVESDVFEGVRGKFDYIFANPPYIPITKKSKVQKSVLKYEPKQALFGGKDGLFYIKKFLSKAQDYLLPGGKIFMEFDPPQKKHIEKLLKKYKYSSWEFHKDQFDKWRWVSITSS